MGGPPAGTAKMIIREIGFGTVLGFVCGGVWKWGYHQEEKRRTKSFYSMLNKDEITVVSQD